MGAPCIVNIYPFYGDDPVKAEGERESEHGTREVPSDNKVGSSGEKEGKGKMKKEGERAKGVEEEAI